MQIAILIKPTNHGGEYSEARWVQRIETGARPIIYTSAEPVECDPSADVETVDAILSEVMTASNCWAGYRIESRETVRFCKV